MGEDQCQCIPRDQEKSLKTEIEKERFFHY